MQSSDGDQAVGRAVGVPPTDILYAPATDGLTLGVLSGRSMSLEERLKQAASTLAVGRSQSAGGSGAANVPLAAVAPQAGFPALGSLLAGGSVKTEHSSGGSGDFGGQLSGDGNGSAAGGQGLDDIMKQARALTEADAALVRAASGAAPGFAAAARGDPPSAPRPDRLLRAGGQAASRSLGETRSMPLNAWLGSYSSHRIAATTAGELRISKAASLPAAGDDKQLPIESSASAPVSGRGPAIGAWHKPVPTLARSGQQGKPVIQRDEAELLESLARVSTPMARPMPRKHAGALLMPELVKRAAVGAVSAARPQPGGRRQHPQSPGTAAADANSVGASQQAGAELLTWLNSAVPVNASAGSAGKGGAEPAAAATSPHAAAAAPADGTQLRRPVSDSHLWITDASGEPRKACPRCRNVKSITEFHRKYADDPMSSQTYCRKCHGDMKKEKGGVRAPTVEEKLCPNCNERKRAALFYPNTITPDGLSENCRSCCKAMAAEVRRKSMADDAARMRSDGSLVGRPARTGSGTTRGGAGGSGGLRHATGSAPHYLGHIPDDEDGRDGPRSIGTTGRQSLNAQLSMRARRRDWQGWRGGKSGRPLLGGGHLGAEPDASGEEFYRASPKEESEEAAVAAAAAALASPRAAAAPSSMAGTAAVQAAVGGASAGPASPTTLARQLELQTGPPPGLTVANMLVWRMQVRENPGMAAVLAALCPNLHHDLGLAAETGQVMEQLRNMQ